MKKTHRPEQGRDRLEGGDEDVWLLLSPIPVVPWAEFVPLGLQVDAVASDKRKGSIVSIRSKAFAFVRMEA